MAAPAAVTRLTPAGLHLFDGYQAFVAFQLAPGLPIWEKKVTCFGLDGREPVEQTTMHNLIYTTHAPRKLRTVTPLLITAAFDPAAWGACNNMLNRVQAVSHYWSDGSVLTAWAFLQKVEMAEEAEGEQPEMNLTVMVASIDPNLLTAAGLKGQGAGFVEQTGTAGYGLSSGEIPSAA